MRALNCPTRKLERIDSILYFPFVESQVYRLSIYPSQELNLLDQYQYNYQILTISHSAAPHILIFWKWSLLALKFEIIVINFHIKLRLD